MNRDESYLLPLITIEKHDKITEITFLNPHPELGTMKTIYTVFVFDEDRLREIMTDNICIS